MPALADCAVVTLAHNNREYTAHLLDSLLAAAVLPRELLIVDNGSTDDTPALLAAAAPRLRAAGIAFTTWRNAENRGCSVARNEAWARATAEYVVLMDNDAAVCTRDWLTRLVCELQADAKLAVLGPKLIYPFRPHPIQCAGVAINPLGRIRFRGRGEPRAAPEYARPAVVPALISACWIMPRRLYGELGGLDPWFHPVQFEDLDFCLRANQAGYHCAYTPAVEIYHFEGRTTASFGQQVYQRNIVEQSTKFRQRWRDVIRTYPPDPADYRWRTDDELGLTPVLDLAQA